jgi:hypothetical protein
MRNHYCTKHIQSIFSIAPSVRKMIQSTITAVSKDYAINWNSPTYHSISLNINRPSPIILPARENIGIID